MSGQPPSRSGRKRRRRGPPNRRLEQHRSAQAKADKVPDRPIIDDPLVCADDAAFVETDEALAELVDHVRAVGRFAYDTEFIGEDTYHPRFCLIQIATHERVAVVDPLARVNVTPVWELIADPELETIVHAGQQDLEPVARLLDSPPGRILDTQIAAAFLDLPYPISLRKLVDEFLGVRLGKAFSFTRWDQRPLQEAHLRYAADDVRYLPAVRARIGEKLEAAGYSRWVREECDELSDISRYRFDPDSRVERLLNNRSMRTVARRLLRELVVFRDQTARARDMPPRALLKDDVLVRLAKLGATSTAALGDVKGLPRPFRQRYGDELVAAAVRVLDQDPEQPVARRLPDESTRDRLRIDSLWALVSNYCRANSIDPALVTNRRQIARVYFSATQQLALESNLETGWRREFVGQLLDDLLNGRARVEFEWRDGRLRVI